MQAHQYFADANEAESWMKEKEPLAGNSDCGKDEDASDALLKRHEAFMSDLEAFDNTIKDLREQAANCRQQETPVTDVAAKECVMALYDYTEKSPREVKKLPNQKIVFNLKRAGSCTQPPIFDKTQISNLTFISAVCSARKLKMYFRTHKAYNAISVLKNQFHLLLKLMAGRFISSSVLHYYYSVSRQVWDGFQVKQKFKN